MAWMNTGRIITRVAYDLSLWNWTAKDFKGPMGCWSPFPVIRKAGSAREGRFSRPQSLEIPAALGFEYSIFEFQIVHCSR